MSLQVIRQILNTGDVTPAFRTWMQQVGNSTGPVQTATLVAGTVTIAMTQIAATNTIFLSRATAGGTLGHLSYTITAGTSFTINSSSATETSTINYLII